MAHHTRLEKMAAEIGRLCADKNEAYGSSFERSGEIMRILYPNGIAPEQYTDALGVVRVIDKLFRIATRKHAFGESPWKDVTGYGLLGAERDDRNMRDAETEPRIAVAKVAG